MIWRPIYTEIVSVILVTVAAYIAPIGLLWLRLGGR